MQISRRRALRLCALAVSTNVVGFGQAHGADNHDSQPIIHDSVASLSRRIRTREISSHDVVSAFLSRIGEVNGTLNAIVRLRAEEALKDAKACDDELAKGKPRGVLHGIPFTVKDSFDTAGLISTAGTTGRAKFIPKEDATVVRRLREAGAILLGKTNTPELTLSYITLNRIYGATRNPYDLRRTPGGSSGGAASILAASGSPLDVGSDSAGSLRVPAHFCGVTCLKPTSGRVPRTGHIIDYRGPLQAMTHVGPMARFVGDLRMVLSVLAGADGVDPHILPITSKGNAVETKRLRVAHFFNNGRGAPSQDTKATVESVVGCLQPHVASTKSFFPSFLDDAYLLYGELVAADGFDWIERILQKAGTKQNSLGMLRKPPPAKSTSEFVQLIEKWDELKSRALSIWKHFDVLICPTSAAPAHKTGTAVPREAFSYSAALNTIGWPAVVVRAGTSSDGLPIGIQVIAPAWRENRALAVAEKIEQELGGWKPIADISALRKPSAL